MYCLDCKDTSLIFNKETFYLECYSCGSRFILEDGDLTKISYIELSPLNCFENKLLYGFNMFRDNE